VRQAGMKAMVRFGYTEKTTAPYGDAPPNIVLGHMDQLAPVLQANLDVIPLVQAGFVGAYGEWFYTDYYGDEGVISPQNQIDRTAVINKWLSILPPTRLIQVRTPAIKRAATGISTPLLYYNSSVNATRIGHHNDCFVSSKNDYGTYENKKDEQWTYTDTTFTNWGGETCSSDPPRSDCPSAMSEMTNLHASYMNGAYNEAVLRSWKKEGCYNQIQSRLGYRLALISSTLKSTGNLLTGSFSIVNLGYAAPYNPREMYLILTDLTNTKNTGTFQIAGYASAGDQHSPPTNIRTWLPCNTTNPIILPVNIVLPSSLLNGHTYSVRLQFIDPLLPTRPEYAIRLANVQTSVSFDTKTGINTLEGFTIVLSSS